jgi:DNA-binding beta-propeller fold protein YncE
MRIKRALLALGVGMLASTACAPTIPTSTSSGPQSSLFGSNTVPKPASTMLEHSDPGRKPRGWFSKHRVKGSLIYVAASDQVVIFPERGNNPAPVGAITDQVSNAYGLFVDGRRDLYVANDSTITAYRPGSLHPWIVYFDNYRPLYVVLDHSGRLYAANQDGSVSEFAPRQPESDRRLLTPGTEADGINVDAADNLYVAYRGKSGNGSIEEFPPKSTKGHVLRMHLVQPQALQLDRSGNILVVETGTRQAIDVFPPGSRSPSQIVRVTLGITQIALRESEKYLYLSNFFNDNVYIGQYPPVQVRPKIETGLKYIEGVALSNEER